MTYDVAELTARDQIRGLVFDDSNDPAAEYLSDARYDTLISRYPDDWRLAAVAAARRIIGIIAARPVALASDGDSIRFSEARVTSLQAALADLLAEIDADSYGGIVTVTADVFTPSLIGGAEW